MEIEAHLFSILGHPQRLAVFRLLMRRYPDALPAGEICAVLGHKPSTASVYLGALRDAGLISQTRQGTSLRYRADISRARALVGFLVNDCCRGRPDLCPPIGARSFDAQSSGAKILNVLFVCTANSARSIMAEALLRALGQGRFAAYSAGTHPSAAPNPIALQILQDKGHDISGLRSKDVGQFRAAGAPQMDLVFTVCDRAANEDCPIWDGQPITAHWGIADPVAATGPQAARHLAFQQAYGALHSRITALTALPISTLDRISLQQAVDTIPSPLSDHFAS